jgi:multicomponent Na+:H+ antiporter subunit D
MSEFLHRDWTFWLPLMVVLSSFVPGVFIFVLAEKRTRLRITLNMIGAIVKLVIIGVMLWGTYHQVGYETRFTLMPGFDFVLDSSALGMLFVTLSGVLWLATTIYAIGYLEHSPHRSRFFGFFSLCVSASTGIALAGNLITFIFFYELLSLTTYPLVVHEGSDEARRAGRTYLAYTLTGGALLLVAVIWSHVLAGPFDFTSGGAFAQMGMGQMDMATSGTLVALFFVFIAGLGVKAAMVPLHGWLPKAMVAPTPVSALLHAVAVVKAGVFGIVRVVYEVFGIELVAQLGVDIPLAIMASVTILYGSILALYQDNLKRMLAYSTVSQLSYIVLGVAILGTTASIGGLVHLVHQGLMKVTLFFCAGSFAKTLGRKHISQLAGVGRRMPLTMIAFTIAAFGMIGVPPLAGFVSKWYLGAGAADTGAYWVVWVLVVSTILNAAYFLPVVYTGWFGEQDEPFEEHFANGSFETTLSLLAPTLGTAALVVYAGLFAYTPVSPLEWVKIIAERIFL